MNYSPPNALNSVFSPYISLCLTSPLNRILSNSLLTCSCMNVHGYTPTLNLRAGVLPWLNVHGCYESREGTLAKTEWNREGRRHLQGETGQFLERLCTGKLKSYFHATLSMPAFHCGTTFRQRSRASIVKANNQRNELITQHCISQTKLDSLKERKEGKEEEGQTWIPMDCNKCDSLQSKLIHFTCLKFNSIQKNIWINGT